MSLNFSVTIEHDAEVVGRLQIMGSAASDFDGKAVAVSSELNYATYVVNGTRPHMIYPRAKRALFWPGADHPVRSVQHPGTKPNPFMSDALVASTSQIEAHITDEFTAVVNGEGGNYTQILLGAGLILQAAIQRASPVKTGGLRSSFHTERVS